MPPEQPPITPLPPDPQDTNPFQGVPITSPPAKSHKKLFIGLVLLIVLMVVLMAAIVMDLTGKKTAKVESANNSLTKQQQAKSDKAKTEGLQLDPKKNYGDKYKSGILPVGDNKYVTTAAKIGNVYLCQANFVPAGQAGAQTRGPWFIGTTQYDVNKKAHVNGQVVWVPSLGTELKAGQFVITTNDLPNHVTGVFPVSSTDPAYAYDRNPNTIRAQELVYGLNASPAYGSPHCMGGEAGVMLTGVALFNAFDAGGRDAGAWEVQDSCDGHPQNKGEYHYHSLSSCIVDTSVHTIIGYALDGFPITGPKVGTNNILTTADLDACHGITSEVNIDDNKKANTYHYVMTQDFPYSVSCFRGNPIQPPGDHEVTGQPNHP
jgi:hypothetical protein